MAVHYGVHRRSPFTLCQSIFYSYDLRSRLRHSSTKRHIGYIESLEIKVNIVCIESSEKLAKHYTKKSTRKVENKLCVIQQIL